jgi:hypothetical protein
MCERQRSELIDHPLGVSQRSANMITSSGSLRSRSSRIRLPAHAASRSFEISMSGSKGVRVPEWSEGEWAARGET